MDQRYYVQVIAENYLKNVVEDPPSMKVHERFLQGLEPEEFREGFGALLALVRGLYGAVAQDPGSFGMLLKENVQANAKNADYTGSNASFLRVPHLLLALGACSLLQPDFSLAVEGGALSAYAKALSIANAPALLALLREHGFVITGLGKALKAEDLLVLSFPDSRALPVALKAMAQALLEINQGDPRKPKNYFTMMHPGLLEAQTVKAPKLTVQALCHALDPRRQDMAAALHESVSGSAKQAVRMGGFMRNDWSCVYTSRKSKKVLMSLQVNQEELSVKLNLQHIGAFIPVVLRQPDRIQNAILSSGWECGRCNPGCSGPFCFEMGGKSYRKCRCGSFVFSDLIPEDIPGCQELLRQEILQAGA